MGGRRTTGCSLSSSKEGVECEVTSGKGCGVESCDGSDGEGRVPGGVESWTDCRY